MAIRKNPDGKTVTDTRGGGDVFGSTANGGGTPRRSAPMARSTAKVPKRLPVQRTIVPKKSR